MSKKCIVVLGTVSVQRYIFQSNRLKEIIGASDLAKHWFDDGLIQAIKQTVSSLDRAAWKAYKDNPSISQSEVPESPDADVNVIYIGGGNAVLLCKNKNIATKVVENWSLNLLKNAPGLRVAVGYGNVSESLPEAYNKAMDKLNRCEEALPCGAELGGLPVVQTCSTTGLSASRRSKEENKREEWISHSAASKREQVGIAKEPGKAQETIRGEFKSVLKENQHFAIELDKLGGGEGQSYMAVVHADGNGMGELLNEAVRDANDDEFLHYIRAFSASVSQLSKNAFEKTMQYYQDVLPSLKGIKEHENAFPMRPIVYGGDDLTYVCDGRVGLHLTAYYLQEFAKEPIKVGGEDRHVDACAGVAIVHTKFPIAQAYRFADELCGLAKSHRDRDSGGSWLDFQIIQAGATGSVSTIRSSQYRSLEGQTLHQRPYQIPETWERFVEMLRGFQSKQWPRSRAKSLMQALTKGPSETERFVQAAKWRDISLPPSEEDQSGWSGGDAKDCTTPYFDPLEALDFYLEDLLTTPPAKIDEGEENSE
ncbi:hypothetical protein F4055_04040 [Candidatus Poribacteria bacterium]|nr:hypothetical protein [Candidatus Poribacteria bacterium]